MRNYVILAIMLLHCACEQPRATPSLAPPLVDGDCKEYETLDATIFTLSEEVTLYIYQNAHFVWISYCFPEGSYGTLDLEIQTERIKDWLNLHVSAQLGEWPTGDIEVQPKIPESDLWWNMNGWTANPLWPNGLQEFEGEAEYKLKNGNARELQLSKARFGKGLWKIKMKINAIKGSDGEFYSIVFPESGGSHRLAVD